MKSKRPVCLAASELRAANTPRILRYLIAVSLRRLKQAQQMEKSRNVVFPESSVVARDIVKMMARLETMVNARRSAEPQAKRQKRTVDL